MPSLATPTAPKLVKMILIGDSGSGKTGSLVSLVQAGYKLRVLDMDNKLVTGILPRLVQRLCPDRLDSVQYEAIRNKWKSSSQGPVLDGSPRAYPDALKLMERWSDGTAPKDWGPDHIFVLDSLTFFSNAAFEWAQGMNPGAKDPRQWYGLAQEAVENNLALLTAEAFNTNVIVISHVSWIERPDGTMKGYPNSVGKALGPTIPAYFDNVALCQTVGAGASTKRTIQTVPTALIDLKNPASFAMLPTLPIETGLAEFFKTVKGQ